MLKLIKKANRKAKHDERKAGKRNIKSVMNASELYTSDPTSMHQTRLLIEQPDLFSLMKRADAMRAIEEIMRKRPGDTNSRFNKRYTYEVVHYLYYLKTNRYLPYFGSLPSSEFLTVMHKVLDPNDELNIRIEVDGKQLFEQLTGSSKSRRDAIDSLPTYFPGMSMNKLVKSFTTVFSFDDQKRACPHTKRLRETITRYLNSLNKYISHVADSDMYLVDNLTELLSECDLDDLSRKFRKHAANVGTRTIEYGMLMNNYLANMISKTVNLITSQSYRTDQGTMYFVNSEEINLLKGLHYPAYRLLLSISDEIPYQRTLLSNAEPVDRIAVQRVKTLADHLDGDAVIHNILASSHDNNYPDEIREEERLGRGRRAGNEIWLSKSMPSIAGDNFVEKYFHRGYYYRALADDPGFDHERYFWKAVSAAKHRFDCASLLYRETHWNRAGFQPFPIQLLSDQECHRFYMRYLRKKGNQAIIDRLTNLNEHPLENADHELVAQGIMNIRRFAFDPPPLIDWQPSVRKRAPMLATTRPGRGDARIIGGESKLS